MNKSEEKTLYKAVLCFLVRPQKVLLNKKVLAIGEGLWNGYGGGIETTDKSPKDAAAREVEEESGGIQVLPRNLETVAEAFIHNTKEDGTTFVCHVSVFLAREWIGVPSSTEEMIEPTWFDFRNLPKKKLLEADRIWLPIVLSGEKIIVKARYGPHQKYLIGAVDIQYVDSF